MINDGGRPRLVIVGRNSTVWRAISKELPDAAAIGHREIAQFAFRPHDVVWILAYSRTDSENQNLFTQLARTSASQFVYVSSATAIIADRIRCYSYPRAKRNAERLAIETLSAKIIRLGIVSHGLDDLPSGFQLHTSYNSIVTAMRVSLEAGPERLDERLFVLRERPMKSRIEQMAYALYGAILPRLPLPCIARPLDVLLRAVGWRWYGYVFLSNRQWQLTAS